MFLKPDLEVDPDFVKKKSSRVDFEPWLEVWFYGLECCTGAYQEIFLGVHFFIQVILILVNSNVVQIIK